MKSGLMKIALALALVTVTGCSLLQKAGLTDTDLASACSLIGTMCDAPKDKNTAQACAILTQVCAAQAAPSTTTTTTLAPVLLERRG